MRFASLFVKGQLSGTPFIACPVGPSGSSSTVFFFSVGGYLWSTIPWSASASFCSHLRLTHHILTRLADADVVAWFALNIIHVLPCHRRVNKYLELPSRMWGDSAWRSGLGWVFLTLFHSAGGRQSFLPRPVRPCDVVNQVCLKQARCGVFTSWVL